MAKQMLFIFFPYPYNLAYSYVWIYSGKKKLFFYHLLSASKYLSSSFTVYYMAELIHIKNYQRFYRYSHKNINNKNYWGFSSIIYTNWLNWFVFFEFKWILSMILFIEFPMPKIWPIKCIPKMISMYVKCSRLYIRVVISYVNPIQWVNHHRFHRLGRYEYHHRNLVLHTKRPGKNTKKEHQLIEIYLFFLISVWLTLITWAWACPLTTEWLCLDERKTSVTGSVDASFHVVFTVVACKRSAIKTFNSKRMIN